MNTNYYKDKIFLAALVAAPLFWLALALFSRPDINIAWPINWPARFLLLTLVYPVLEEIVFRGWLQGMLYARRPGRKACKGISVANAITSLVFVTAHFLYHSVGWSIAVLIPSLVFGYLRDRYGTIKPGIVLHVYFNTGYFWIFNSSF